MQSHTRRVIERCQVPQALKQKRFTHCTKFIAPCQVVTCTEGIEILYNKTTTILLLYQSVVSGQLVCYIFMSKKYAFDVKLTAKAPAKRWTLNDAIAQITRTGR